MIRKLNASVLILLSIFGALLLGLVINSSYLIQENLLQLKCAGNYMTMHQKKSLKGNVEVSLSQNNGVIVFNGTLYDAAGQASEFTLDVLFSFKVVNNTLVLTASDVNVHRKGIGTESGIIEYQDLLPSFFSRKGSSIMYTIYSHNNIGYIFSRGELPVFYCTRLINPS